jgi:hypothetical protein
MRYFIFIVFGLFFSFGFSQTKISGEIINEENASLSETSIIVTKINGNIIISYAISDSEGKYSLVLNSELDSLQINVSYIGYTKQIKTFINKSQSLISNF